VTLKLFTLVEHGVSGNRGGRGVPAPSELRSKSLEVVEDEPELDADGTVESFGRPWRNGVCLMGSGLLSAPIFLDLKLEFVLDKLGAKGCLTLLQQSL